MMSAASEMMAIAERLESARSQGSLPEIAKPLENLEKAVTRVTKAWSGSWIGYHAKIYYEDFEPPPLGARFSQEWGLTHTFFNQGTIGDWVEYDGDVVKEFIYKTADNPNVEPAREWANAAEHTFQDCRAEIISVITTLLSQGDDPFLSRTLNDIENVRILTASDFVTGIHPKQVMSRDMGALGQGIVVPAHIMVWAEVKGIQSTGQACSELSGLAKRAGSHLVKRETYGVRKIRIGTKVFIGHGRALVWRDLKDFIQDRVGLPWDEFNRVPIAGITNIARLSEMLSDAAIAFLVMTGEDEQADGKLHARLNVVHEAGLFQGRLGFTKAILLLEEECEEFSNIHGLGQIRFPSGNIKAVFEDIRQVLEREGLLS